MAAQFDAADIRRYYDRHTASFVRFGQGSGSLHRAVWGAGTQTQDDAFHYVDDQIASLARRFVGTSPDVHVVDLGCGVGASLCYLAKRLPIRGTGITLSPAQAMMAQQAISAAGLSDRVRCIEGDYCDLPASLGPAHVAYAIESFVHGPSPQRFFEQSHRLIVPGGVLIVCDDVMKNPDAPGAARRIDEFRTGWHINTLLDREALVRMASDAGLDHDGTRDLTPLLDIERARDRVIRLVAAILKRLPLNAERFDYVIGGDALQTCLARGWIGYEINVFKRR
jgi:cyclopropane fatty-acyl-phospholipid synthase-like methyltransferase